MRTAHREACAGATLDARWHVQVSDMLTTGSPVTGEQANARRQVTIALHVMAVGSVIWGGHALLSNRDMLRLMLRHDCFGSVALKGSS